MSYLLIIAYVISTAGGLVLIKLGSAKGLPVNVLEGILRLSINPSFIMGIILYLCSFLLYIYLLSRYELGFIIPITTALVYTVVFIASYFIFHESFTIIKIVAIVLIVFGVLLLSFGK